MECHNFVVLAFLVLTTTCRGSDCSLNISSLRDVFNLTVIKYNLSHLYHDLEQRVNSSYNFLRYNWMLDEFCAKEFEECNATISCCDEDLFCHQLDNSSRCANISWVNDTFGEDLDNHMNRLNDLTYDINYRDWVNSFEFESRSAMRREEEKAKEEEEWREKHKHELQEERKWLPLLKTLVEKSKRKWKEVQKMKKLKEVKDIIREKISSRKHEDSLPSNEETASEVTEQEEATEQIEISKPKHKKKHKQEKVKQLKEKDSIESRKKTYPGIDQLLRDADDVVKEHKKDKVKFSSEERTTSDENRSNEIAQIEDTEDKLEEELKRLKALQKQEEKKAVVEGLEGAQTDEIKELIKKQVALILEQERKLSGLMKLNELKKMQENLNAQKEGGINAQA